MDNNLAVEKRKFKFPTTLVCIFIMIIIATILTHVIPAGKFESYLDPSTGIEKVDASSFHYIESSPIGPFQMFVKIQEGFISASDIIFLIVFACFYIVLIVEMGALHGVVNTLRKKLKGKDFLIVPIFIIVISFAGVSYGEMEDVYPLIPLFVGIAMAIGYDAIVGVAMSGGAVIIGFVAGALNPYNVGIGQGFAELPLFSGMLLRWGIYVVFTGLLIWWTLRYGKKIKENPELSYVSDQDYSDVKLDEEEMDKAEFNIKHKLVLIGLGVCIAVMVYGCLVWGWFFNEIAAWFLVCGVVTGLLGGFKPDELGYVMIDSTKSVILGLLVIGFARSIYMILSASNIIDTIIYGLYQPLKSLPGWVAAIGMYVVHNIINLFIPSATGQASAAMPIMVPLSDLVNVPRQVAVLAYQLGDGWSKLIWPTANAAVVCGLGKVPLDRWYKFFLPLFGIFFVLSSIIIALATVFSYGPF